MLHQKFERTSTIVINWIVIDVVQFEELLPVKCATSSSFLPFMIIIKPRSYDLVVDNLVSSVTRSIKKYVIIDYRHRSTTFNIKRRNLAIFPLYYSRCRIID